MPDAEKGPVFAAHGACSAALRAIGDARLAGYQPYWAALAALAERAGEAEAAMAARQRAAGLATDPAVRRFLLGPG